MNGKIRLFFKDKLSVESKTFWTSIVMVGVSVVIIFNLIFKISESNEFQSAMKEESIESYVIFGDHAQYVALDYHNPRVGRHSDRVTELMVGRNHIVKLYDLTEHNHSAYIVDFDIESNLNKKIIDLSPYLKKIPNYKFINRISSEIRTIYGQDYLFLRTSSSTSKAYYVYNLDTENFLSQDLNEFIYHEKESLAYGDQTALMMREPSIWAYFNQDERSSKSKVQTSSGAKNIMQLTTYPEDKENIYNLNLFKDYPKIKAVYHRVQYPQKNPSRDEFYVVARLGVEGEYPPAPIKPQKPKKANDIFFEYSLPLDYISPQGFLNQLAEEKYQSDTKIYESLIMTYKENKAKNFEKQSHIYFDSKEFAIDKGTWLQPLGYKLLD